MSTDVVNLLRLYGYFGAYLPSIDTLRMNVSHLVCVCDNSLLCAIH